MGFFDKVGDVLSNTGREISASAKNVADTSNLNSQIRAQQTLIQSLYKELGEKYYEESKDDPTCKYADKVASITDAKNKIVTFQHVSYLGTEGYALASYLTLAGSSAAQNPAPAAQILHVINCNEYITLRATPSTSGTDLAHIPLGAAVTFVANSSNGFYEVSYNGQDGYALASYLGS